MSRDSLGDRMKGHYENRTRFYLPRRTYTVLRLDGKAFHTFTRGCERPYDSSLMQAMDATAKALCEAIQGARLAYVQSDEISVVLTDFETESTEAWFDGNLQKVVSISASVATAAFNAAWREMATEPGEWALFDSRAFTIPDPEEVTNYLIWRQQDATRNSIQMAAQCHFSAEEVFRQPTDRLQEMLWSEHGINWNDYPAGCKRGRVVIPRTFEKSVEYMDKRTGKLTIAEGVQRREWRVEEPPIFSRSREWLREFIPRPG